MRQVFRLINFPLERPSILTHMLNIRELRIGVAADARHHVGHGFVCISIRGVTADTSG
jgi:hypothetical protein